MYSDKLLDTQLSYFRFLFDTQHALKKLGEERQFEGEGALAGHMDTLKTVYKHVNSTLEKSARRYVALASLF